MLRNDKKVIGNGKNDLFNHNEVFFAVIFLVALFLRPVALVPLCYSNSQVVSVRMHQASLVEYC